MVSPDLVATVTALILILCVGYSLLVGRSICCVDSDVRCCLLVLLRLRQTSPVFVWEEVFS